MRRLLSCTVCALLLCVPLTSSLHAEEQQEPKALDLELSLEMLYSGKVRFTKPLPRWSWRPKHSQLVRVTGRAERWSAYGPRPYRVLAAREVNDPKETVLLDFRDVEKLVGVTGTRMRGIGRAGPPLYRWAESGTALCVVLKGNLVWVDLATGTKRRLTYTRKPIADLRVAPNGRHVSFSRENELWVVDTDRGRPRKLTGGGSETLRNGTLDWVYPEEFGFNTAAWWSPDSKRVALLQLDEAKVPKYRLPAMIPLRSDGRTMRYPKAGDVNPLARLAVTHAAGGDPVWLKLGKPEYVVRVAWTPDAKRVLVVTLDRNQQHLELRSCDPSSGESVVLFEENDGAWIDAPPAPKFIDANRFQWRSNRDGHRGWYLVTTDAAHVAVEKTVPLTPPKFDASRLHYVNPTTEAAYFSGTGHGGVGEGVFASQGPAPEVAGLPLHAGMGWTSVNVEETGTYAIVTASSDRRPSEMSLWNVRQRKPLEVLGRAHTAVLDSIKFAKPEYGRIPLPDCPHGNINYRLWKPADFDPKRKYPLIVHTYAGPGSRMVRNSWGRGPLLVTLLTQRGFLVLQADGRGTGAQGPAFTRTVYKRLGMLELEDQARAVQELSKRPYVDAERVGIWGWSYGGTMACNALTMRSDVFKVGVGVAPVTDWRLYDTIYTERYMGVPKDNRKGYDETASSKHAKTMNGHLLLMHGLGDDNVHAQNTYRLVEALLKAKKKTFDVMTYPYRKHGIEGAGLDVFRRMLAYFERNL